MKDTEDANLGESSMSIGAGANPKTLGILPGTPDCNLSKTTNTIVSLPPDTYRDVLGLTADWGT